MSELSELRKYLRALLRWWWLVVAAIGVATGLSYVNTSRQPRVYEATATVIVGQSFNVIDPSSTDLETSSRLAYTYSLIIRRQPVMQGVVDALELEQSWRELRSNVQVYVIPNTQLIEITTRGESTTLARQIADEVAHQLILQSPTTLGREEDEESESRKFVTQRIKRLQEKINEGQAEIDQLEETMINAGNPSEKQALKREIADLEAIVSAWENNYSRYLAFVENEESSNVVAVIEPAQARSTPVSPDLQMNLLLAAALGAVLGLALVFLLDNIDDTLKTEEELEAALGLLPLGTVNLIKARTEGEKLIHSQNPFSQASEAYRMIRSNLQFLKVNKKEVKTILIASAGSGEGKSLTAANLAIVMAQARYETILVDADLRQPKQHEIFDLPQHGGLTELLRPGDEDLDELIGEHLKKTTVERLEVLNSGARPPNPSELLGSERMKEILDRLAARADVIILDGMPLLPVADSVVLSTQVNGVLLVADAGKTRRADLRKALNKLNKAGVHILGGILNRTPGKMALYRGKGYEGKEAPAQLERPAATD